MARSSATMYIRNVSPEELWAKFMADPHVKKGAVLTVWQSDLLPNHVIWFSAGPSLFIVEAFKLRVVFEREIGRKMERVK